MKMFSKGNRVGKIDYDSSVLVAVRQLQSQLVSRLNPVLTVCNESNKNSCKVDINSD